MSTVPRYVLLERIPDLQMPIEHRLMYPHDVEASLDYFDVLVRLDAASDRKYAPDGGGRLVLTQDGNWHSRKAPLAPGTADCPDCDWTTQGSQRFHEAVEHREETGHLPRASLSDAPGDDTGARVTGALQAISRNLSRRMQ